MSGVTRTDKIDLAMTEEGDMITIDHGMVLTVMMIAHEVLGVMYRNVGLDRLLYLQGLLTTIIGKQFSCNNWLQV